jgi:hypothetical protein
MSTNRKRTMQILTMSAMSLSFIAATPSVSFAAGATQSGSKLSAQICPDGNPCPPLPAGSIDCTPKAGKALPVECSLAPGKGVNEPEEFDVSSLPGISVTPGAAKSATTFNLGPLKAALGKYAAMPVFFVNYGDGTGYGSSSDLRSLNSFPSSHIYVQAGTYTITGYAVADGRTESTTMTVVIEPANQPDPTPDKVSSGDWDPTATPKANAVIPVASTSSAGGLSIGTGGSVIAEATSNAPSASAAKAPVVNARANQVVIVSVPSLQTGTDVVGRVRIGTTWRTLPKSEVGEGGVLTLPALTFSKAGTYSVKLSLETGGSRYVMVKVKK